MEIRINIVLLFFILFTTQISFSQEQIITPKNNISTIDASTDTLENSLLWQISGNGLSQNSYLFGTIHLIAEEDFIFTDTTKVIFDKCNAVAFEIKLDDVMNLSTQFSLMTKVFMSEGKTLRNLLEEEDYTVVKDYFKDMGLPLTFLERMKPMFLSALVSGDLSGDSEEKMVSYEFELMDRAQMLNKEIAGLETLEFQMSIFDKIPYDVQAQMLVESIKVSDAGNDQFKEMVELYKAQNLNGLQRLINSDTEGIADYEDILLNERNKNWISKMENMMEEKRVFFAVGAGHLAGEEGVIKLLRKQGYTVTAIKPEPLEAE